MTLAGFLQSFRRHIRFQVVCKPGLVQVGQMYLSIKSPSRSRIFTQLPWNHSSHPPSHAIIQVWLSPLRQIQNTSPSSFELVGVSGTELARESTSNDGAREELGVGDDLTLAAEVCFLSFDGIGFRWVEIGVALGERYAERLTDGLRSVSLSFDRL